MRCLVEGSRSCLEASLQDMMDIITIHDIQVKISAAIIDKGLEKLPDQFHIELADLYLGDLYIVNQIRSPRKVYGD